MPKTALIVVDMLNAYDHPDAEELALSVEKSLGRMVELRDAAKTRDDVRLVYVNDNYDAWEAGRETLIERAMDGKHPELVEPIAPEGDRPFLPKGRHSIFYETALAHLLRVDDISASCSSARSPSSASSTARWTPTCAGYEVIVPPDAVAHIDGELAKAALRMMERQPARRADPGGGSR